MKRRTIVALHVSYGNKYIYQSTLDSETGARLIMILTNDPRLVSTQNQIDLRSNFGRLFCALLFYQDFQKSLAMTNEPSDLTNYIFTYDTLKFTFHQILAALVMSIIERECDRGTLQFPSSKQLVRRAARTMTSPTNNPPIDPNHWLYLLIQSLSEYIENSFSSSFSWISGANRNKQRQKLSEILNKLQALSTKKIVRNKTIAEEVRQLRLQTLANLKFPVADRREINVRPISDIEAWKEEQKLK